MKIQILIIILLLITSCTKVKVSDAVTKFQIDERGLYLLPVQNGYYILDTGAEKTIIFSDLVKEKSSFMSYEFMNLNKMVNIRFVKTLRIGNIEISNLSFISMDRKTTQFVNDSKLQGIIGMDILSSKLCIFDNKERLLTLTDSIAESIKPAMELEFKNRLHPMVNISINRKLEKDILFDLGFSTFISLTSSHPSISKMNTEFIDISGKKTHSQNIPFDSIIINNIVFYKCGITFNSSMNAIGANFAKCWSKFCIDSDRKKLLFFK